MGSSHSSVTPDSSPWYPVDGGNYSVWEQTFLQQIDKYCTDGFTFANGNRVKVNSLASSALRNLFTGNGRGALRNAISKQSLSSYLGHKPASIVLLAFGIVLFLFSIALACAIAERCRDCWAKFVPSCRSKVRKPPSAYEGFGYRMLAYKVIAFISFALLFGLGIASIFYASALNDGTNGTTCDFWLTSYGHFFGSDQLGLPEGTVSQWEGTVKQWDRMTSMANAVNPKPDGEDGTKRCELCNKVEKDYSGPGGLKETLEGSANKTFYSLNKIIAFLDVIRGGLTSFKSPTTKLAIDKWAVISPKDTRRSEKPQFAFLGAGSVLLRSFYTDLKEATDTGVKLFRDNIDKYLGRDSSLLSLGYKTAKNGISALDDVNYVLAKILVMWTEDVYPLAKGVVTTLVVLTILMGILGIFTGCFGFYLMIKFQRDTQANKAATPKMTKFLGAIYGIVIVFAGFSFLLFTILMFAGSTGSDACHFIDINVYEQGDWDAFPPKFLEETVTNHTSIPTVLDTCVKRSGDGDIAGSLGLRLLLDNLKQQVAVTADELTFKTEDTLMLNFREQKTEALKQIASNSVEALHYYTGSIDLQKDTLAGLGLSEALTKYLNDHLSRVFEKPTLSYNPALSKPLPFLGMLEPLLTGDFNLDVIYPLLSSLTAPFQAVAPAESVLAEVKDILSEAGAPQTGMCSTALTDNKFDKCTFVKGKTIDTSDPKAAAVDLVAVFKALDKKFGPEEAGQRIFTLLQRYSELFWLGGYYSAANKWISSSYSSFVLTNFTEELPGLFTDLVTPAKPIPSSITIQRVFDELAPKYKDPSCEPAKCPHIITLKTAKDYLEGETIPTLQEAFELANDRVWDFVKNKTLQRFDDLLASADKGLEEFNCQYLGTALENGVATGLCGVIMPAIVSLGVIAFVFSLGSVLCAWVLWRSYRYYRDLHNLGVVESPSLVAIGELPPYDPAEIASTIR